METREEAEFDVYSKIFEHIYCQGKKNGPAVIVLSTMRRALSQRELERPFRDNNQSAYYAAMVCIAYFRQKYPVRWLFFAPKIRQDGEKLIARWKRAMA